MAFDLILSNVAKHIDLAEQEKVFFTNLLVETKVNKKTYIVQNGTLCRNINFVNTGLLRAFYLNNEGKEATVMFAISDWWITDMYCFSNVLPAMVNIEAVKESHILSLSKSNFDLLVKEVPKFERFFRIMFQKAYVREQLRMIQRLSAPAEERYYSFLEKYPQIARHITQKQIASYLGITPEFLSMIRANRSHI